LDALKLITIPIPLQSDAFADGQPIPVKYTADGANVSPPLRWSGLPSGTKELALIVDDPDAPDPAAPLGPAWKAGGGDVHLPVYHHWEFGTGPEGDFESLARRLQPFKASARIGFERMYIGAGGPPLPALGADKPAAYLDLDGALRAPIAVSPTLADVPAAVQTALKHVLNASANQLTSGTDDPILGPPIYGGWHARRHAIDDDVPAWLKELNLDPRARAAAGLGAAIVRANQEQYVQWCWEQVGRILEANRLMSRAVLSLEVLARLHARYLATLPAEQLFSVAAPLHDRTKQGAITIGASIARSSLPNAAADPALRRLTSPTRPMLRAALARALPAAAPVTHPRVRLVSGLASGTVDVDPTRFVPHGLLGTALDSVTLPANANADVDLSAAGLPVVVKAAMLTGLREDSAAAAINAVPAIFARADLSTTGVLGEVHLERARELADDPRAPIGGLVTTLTTVRARIDTISTTTINIGFGEHGGLIATPTPAIAPHPVHPAPPVVIAPDDTHAPAHPPDHPVEATVTFPSPLRDGGTIARLQKSLTRAAPGGQIGSTPPDRELVAFAVDTASAALLARTNPRITVPLRLGAMLAAGGGASLLDAPPPGLTVAPDRDRIMAAPELDVPVYRYLATLDASRLLPGVGEIPDEAITLLETNSHFVEGLLVGINVEMNRELLWREFPTDQRGTPLRSFWDRAGVPDIEPIHSWTAANGLGSNSVGGPGGQIALLVRGRLLHRYPNTAIYAWRSGDNGRVVNPPGPDDIKFPVFSGVLGSDIAFAGFDLTDTALTEGAGWFFVLQEQPTEPRFGFDELDAPPGTTPPALTDWSNATWEHTGTAPGGWLRIAGSPLAGTQLADARFVDHAGHLAKISLQKPFRVAVHARQMVIEAPHA
jgi:hypothetical protein